MNTSIAKSGITRQDIVPAYTYEQIVRLCAAQNSVCLRIRYGVEYTHVRLELHKNVKRKHPILAECDVTIFRARVPTALVQDKFKDWAGLVAEIVHFWKDYREGLLAVCDTEENEQIQAKFQHNHAYILWNFVRQSATFNSMKDDMTGKPWAHFK